MALYQIGRREPHQIQFISFCDCDSVRGLQDLMQRMNYLCINSWNRLPAQKVGCYKTDQPQGVFALVETG